MTGEPRRAADDPGSEGESSGEYARGYFDTRMADSPHRDAVWRHVCRYLARWIDPDAEVLELGAGWCSFANNVRASRIVAMDIDKTVERAARPGVEAVVGDCTDLSRFRDACFDVVFASNLLEHLERPAATALLAEAHRVLRPAGRLVLVQPNFRLDPGGYFDDFTHVAIYTDRSLQDYLVSEGWRVEHAEARFLPLTMKSRASALSFLVPLYLRSPIRPLAGQMLVVASPSTAAAP